MTGCGSSVSVIIIRLQRANNASTSAMSRIARISLRSCPAQNPRPRAATTTTRTSGFAAMLSSVACNSPMSAVERALNWPGRFSVTVAIPSVVSTRSKASSWVVVLDVIDSSVSRVVTSERNAARDQAMLVRLPLEAFLEVRMRDANQALRTLRDRFSLQVDHSILRDDEHHVGPWRGDDVARCEVQHDPAAALATLRIRRRQ